MRHTRQTVSVMENTLKKAKKNEEGIGMDWVNNFLNINEDILNMACKLIQSEEYQRLRVQYEMHPKKYMSEAYHRRISTEAANLAKNVVNRGGTAEEVSLALKHLYVCMDAEKYGLDWLRFRKENGIAALAHKYKMEADSEEINRMPLAMNCG